MPPPPAVRSALQAPGPLQRAALFGAGLLLLFVAVQLLPSGSPVAPPTAEVAAAEAVRPRAEVSLVRPGTLAALGLLGGGGLFALWLRRRSGTTAGEAVALESMGQLALGPHGQLRLVRCGSEVLLLGVTAQHVNVLHRYGADAFSGATEGGSGAPEQALAAPVPPSFGDLLRQAGIARG